MVEHGNRELRRGNRHVYFKVHYRLSLHRSSRHCYSVTAIPAFSELHKLDTGATNRMEGSTETWTRIAGFKVQSANHYTMVPKLLPGFRKIVLSTTCWHTRTSAAGAVVLCMAGLIIKHVIGKMWWVIFLKESKQLTEHVQKYKTVVTVRSTYILHKFIYSQDYKFEKLDYQL